MSYKHFILVAIGLIYIRTNTFAQALIQYSFHPVNGNVTEVITEYYTSKQLTDAGDPIGRPYNINITKYKDGKPIEEYLYMGRTPEKVEAIIEYLYDNKGRFSTIIITDNYNPEYQPDQHKHVFTYNGNETIEKVFFDETESESFLYKTMLTTEGNLRYDILNLKTDCISQPVNIQAEFDKESNLIDFLMQEGQTILFEITDNKNVDDSVNIKSIVTSFTKAEQGKGTVTETKIRDAQGNLVKEHVKSVVKYNNKENDHVDQSLTIRLIAYDGMPLGDYLNSTFPSGTFRIINKDITIKFENGVYEVDRTKKLEIESNINFEEITWLANLLDIGTFYLDPIHFKISFDQNTIGDVSYYFKNNILYLTSDEYINESFQLEKIE